MAKEQSNFSHCLEEQKKQLTQHGNKAHQLFSCTRCGPNTRVLLTGCSYDSLSVSNMTVQFMWHLNDLLILFHWPRVTYMPQMLVFCWFNAYAVCGETTNIRLYLVKENRFHPPICNWMHMCYDDLLDDLLIYCINICFGFDIDDGIECCPKC